MKKTILFLCTILLLFGCSNNKEEETIDVPEIEVLSGDAYSELEKRINSEDNLESYSVGVINKYEFTYEDGYKDVFSLDEVLESGDNLHLEQNINSNGLVSNLSGYYYDDTLYTTYNGISYYEEMTKEDIKKTLLFPIDPYLFENSDIEKIDMGKDEDGYLVFIINLKKDSAEKLFLSRYDVYGLDALEDFQIKDNQVIYRFDDNNFIKEDTAFVIEGVVSEKKVTIDYSLNINYFFINNTSVEITDEMKEEHNTYVYYEDININDIKENSIDDEGETVVETFKNRIVSRLGYVALEGKDNIYRAEYNENEVYTIDFNTNTFMYTNYSIDYTYNWVGDVGSMGACTFDYKSETANSSCNETTIDTLKDVKSYLEMELYYCGVTLSELNSNN